MRMVMLWAELELRKGGRGRKEEHLVTRGGGGMPAHMDMEVKVAKVDDGCCCCQ